MARYLLSTYSVEGKAPEPMNDDEMPDAFLLKAAALDEDSVSIVRG